MAHKHGSKLSCTQGRSAQLHTLQGSYNHAYLASVTHKAKARKHTSGILRSSTVFSLLVHAHTRADCNTNTHMRTTATLPTRGMSCRHTHAHAHRLQHQHVAHAHDCKTLPTRGMSCSFQHLKIDIAGVTSFYYACKTVFE